MLARKNTDTKSCMLAKNEVMFSMVTALASIGPLFYYASVSYLINLQSLSCILRDIKIFGLDN